MSYRICKYCIMESGIKGSELEEKHLETDEDLFDHIESEHHIAVRRENETEEECMKRFYKQYPEAENRETCKCFGRDKLRRLLIIRRKRGGFHN